jgi:hypothetical protein
MALSRGVPGSPDLERIVGLARRELDLTNVPDLTPLYAKGSMRLWPIQSAALLDMEAAGGGLYPIGVGHGKTLISLLAGDALGAKRVVLLVPPSLRDQLTRVDIPRYSEAFRFVPPHVVAYSELSGQKKANRLEELEPDLIVADEAHSLKHKDSTRTRRFLRYMKEHPGCRFVALSGTMTSRSLRDYAHLAALALGTRSPVPLSWGALEDWCAALDPDNPYPAPEGALRKLCNVDSHNHDHVRARYRCRLVCSVGVVATEESSIGTSLVIRGRVPANGQPSGPGGGMGGVRNRGGDSEGCIPASVSQALKELRETWTRPDGEEISDALSFSRYARQIAQGFYLRYKAPIDHEWLQARNEWHSEVRAYLRNSSGTGRDSPGLVAALAAREPEKFRAWRAWEALKDRPEPASEVVWLSDFLARDAAEWLKDGGICWAAHPAMGQRIADLGVDTKFFGAGEAEAVERYRGKAVVLSTPALHKGLNVQDRYSRCLFTHVPGVLIAEQAIGRIHRPGQVADTVEVDIYLHTAEVKERWERTKEEAEYVQGTMGKQKILLATRVDA